jgi:hypothetical protein
MSAPVTERPRTAVRGRADSIPAQRGIIDPAVPGTDPGTARRTAQQKAYARRDERLRRVAGVRPARAVAPAGRPQFVLLIMVLLAVGLVATLWLSTAAAADSYRLQDATAEARVLSEQAERLHQDVARLASAPELARRAGELGMTPVRDPARLVVGPDGRVEVVGEPRAAVPPPPPAPPEPLAPPGGGPVPEGAAPDGTAPDGTAPDGTAPEGTAPDGTAPDGTAPDGTAPDGTAPDGTAPDGTAPDGTAPDGTAPEGTAPDGAASEGAVPEGTDPWANTDGNSASRLAAEGDGVGGDGAESDRAAAGADGAPSVSGTREERSARAEGARGPEADRSSGAGRERGGAGADAEPGTARNGAGRGGGGTDAG